MPALSTIVAALAVPAISMASVLPRTDDPAVGIVGGVPAESHEFPSIGAMTSWSDLAQRFGKHCGSAIIGPNVAVTAAHCLQASNPWTGYYRVRVGSDRWDRGGRMVDVTAIKSHPGYIPGKEDNDIGLIFWKESIKADGKNVKYATLTSKGQDPAPSSKLTVAGWGDFKSGGPGPDWLYKVDIETVGRQQCRNAYGSGRITENMFCAALPGKDSCQGDSGGPIYIAGSQVQVGVVSWGKGCALPQYPGVYTRLGNFIDWVNQNKNSPPASLPPRQ